MKLSSLLRIDLFWLRLYKLIKILFYPKLIYFLFKGISPAFEHENVLSSIERINTLVDCGSNKGQFAILCYSLNNIKNFIGIDPIIYPKEVLLFFKRNSVKCSYKKIALSNIEGSAKFFLTERNDSSSLKKTSFNSKKFFRDVYEVGSVNVQVSTLNSLENELLRLCSPRLLKIDVQGNEYELLEGSYKVLDLFEYIFIECSHENLYENVNFDIQDIHNKLTEFKFELIKEYNYIWRNNKLISVDRAYKKIRSSIIN